MGRRHGGCGTDYKEQKLLLLLFIAAYVYSDHLNDIIETCFTRIESGGYE